MKNYLDQLRASAQAQQSILCFGIDPKISALPEDFQNLGIAGFPPYLKEIFEEIKHRNVGVGAFKPNFGFYGIHNKSREGDFSGWEALSDIMDLIERYFPGIPIIGDWKLGDIALSSENYAKIYFEDWKVDAGTVSPWMGHDSVFPFAEFAENGIYVLNRTSNPGAQTFQEKTVLTGLGNIPMYRIAAEEISDWAGKYPGRIGGVVGATSLEQLKEIAHIYKAPQVAMLIPGVGKQGGKADEVANALREVGYPLELARINVSSGVTHPWDAKKEKAPNNYEVVVVDEIIKYNELIGYIPS